MPWLCDKKKNDIINDSNENIVAHQLVCNKEGESKNNKWSRYLRPTTQLSVLQGID